MKYQDQTQQLRQAIDGFATTLNTANGTLIQDFFTDDGKFMPQGFGTLSSQQLEASANSFLAVNAFHIAFEIQDISIDDDFATVIAKATTSQRKPGSAAAIEKTSRDFFVYRKIDNAWKIHRYIFNNVILH